MWKINPGRSLRTPYTAVYDAVYDRIHAIYASYTTVFRRITWSSITVGYLRGRIRRNTERLRSWTTVFFPYTIVNERLWKIMVHWPWSFPVLCQSLKQLNEFPFCNRWRFRSARYSLTWMVHFSMNKFEESQKIYIHIFFMHW